MVNYETYLRDEELSKWRLINSCHDFKSLCAAIESISDINGVLHCPNGDVYSGVIMAVRCAAVAEGKLAFSNLTRQYGIRQQAMYIAHCESSSLGQGRF